jgi:hypothetical protein
MCVLALLDMGMETEKEESKDEKEEEKRHTRGGNSLMSATDFLAPTNASVFSASSELVS